jgi:hypothetical protein
VIGVLLSHPLVMSTLKTILLPIKVVFLPADILTCVPVRVFEGSPVILSIRLNEKVIYNAYVVFRLSISHF